MSDDPEKPEVESEPAAPKRKRVPKVLPTPPGPSKPERIVWFSCRATPGCTGKQAAVVFTKGVSGQDSTTRYRCLTCRGSFHVRC